MSMLYVIALFTSMALSVVVLTLAVYTFWSRRHWQEVQERQAPVVERISGCLDAYQRGEVSVGQLCNELHEQRDLGLELLVARAAVATDEQEEKLHAVFRRLGFDQAELLALETGDPQRRVEAALRLGYMGRGRAVGGLLRAIQDEDPQVRLAAAQGLSQLRLGDAALPILRATAGEAGIPTSKATELLVALGEAAVNPLCDFLDTRAGLTVTLPEMLIAACNALGLIGAPRAAPSAIRFAHHQNPNVRAAVARALGGSGNEQAVATLLELAHDNAWEVRAQAVQAIAKLRDKEGVAETLVAATGDPSWWVRHNAARSLSRQGRQGVGALLAILNESPDIYARDAARQVLEEKAIIHPSEVVLQ